MIQTMTRAPGTVRGRRHSDRPRAGALGLLLTLVAALSACGQPSESAAIVAATEAYVRSNSAVSTFTVTVEQVEGDYARARVFPTDQSTDPAWVFLRRDGGRWEALTIGTAFTEETYRELGIPDSLQLN